MPNLQTPGSVSLPETNRLAAEPRDHQSLARTRLQQTLAAQPVDAELRPARWKFFVLAYAEVVIAARINMQFNRNAGALQGDVHERAVFRVGAANFFTVVV